MPMGSALKKTVAYMEYQIEYVYSCAIVNISNRGHPDINYPQEKCELIYRLSKYLRAISRELPAYLNKRYKHVQRKRR